MNYLHEIKQLWHADFATKKELNMKKIVIKTYAKIELRFMYNIKKDILSIWLNAIKSKIPNYNPNWKLLSPLQVKVIFEHYGEL